METWVIKACAGLFERTDLRAEVVCWDSQGSDGRFEVATLE